MASFVFPLISLGSLVVTTTNSLQELGASFATCTSENIWKTIIGTSTSLPISQSYM